MSDYFVVPKSKYARSVRATEAARGEVPRDLIPLFDHLIHLADDSHRHGYFKRAGRELRAARRLARHD